MLNFAIIDDNIQDAMYCCNVLKEELNKRSINTSIKIFTDINEYIMSNIDFYVIFLDIELGGETTGIQLFDKISKHTKIVFITNYDWYIYDAVHVIPFDFIRKSELKNEMENLISKIICSYADDYIKLDFNKPKISIKIKNIVYFESMRNYEICVTDKRKYKIRITQRELIAKINKLFHNSFTKINKTIIINCNHIEDFTHNIVLMDNGEQLFITTVNKKSILEELIKKTL